jgi:hypothetical protein
LILVAEEFGPYPFNSRHHQCAVEEFVSPLAGCFRNEQTALAGRSMKESLLLSIIWSVLRAHRIVRAQPPEF